MMNTGHRRAVTVLTVSLVLLAADSAAFSAAEHIPLWHGLYVIMANAETFGGDVGPSNTAGYICNTIVLLLLIPLLGAAISLITSGLTETQVKKSAADMKDHHETRLAEMEERIKAHAAEQHEKLMRHVSAAVRGGNDHG
jgi:hypothetical protein